MPTIDQISIASNEYRDGDVLALSGLIDLISAYGQAEGPSSLRGKIAALATAYLTRQLQAGSPVDRKFLADTGDLLGFLERLGTKVSKLGLEDAKSRVDAWKTSHRSCLAAAVRTNNGGKPTEESQVAAAPQETATAMVAPTSSTDTAGVGKFLNEEVFKSFLLEASERLTLTQEALLKLESGERSQSLIQDIFRVFHTFKGECGFFKLVSMGELAHQYESLLDLVRDGTLEITPQIIELLFSGLDSFRAMLESLQRQDISIFNQYDYANLKTDIQSVIESVHTPIGEKMVRAGVMTETERDQVLRDQQIGNFTQTFGAIAADKGLIPPAVADKPPPGSIDPKPASGEAINQYIKVQSAAINDIVDMIGELIIAQNQIASDDPLFQHFRKITREIQTGMIKLRTTKLKNLMVNMHRGLRDISRKLGKEAEFASFGEDMEIDRNLVEGLSEPILHMLRNAVHHGIEEPGIRAAAGKAPTATITLGAERLGNTIIISLSDDGRGLDRDAILRRAVERGLITPERSETISDAEIYNFIFEPGFSTAEQIGQISGRGVGMDIVKSYVLANRGRIEIKTEKNRGTRFSLYFPVNTAVVDGLLVTAGKLTLVLPVSQVIETIDLTEETTHSVSGKVEILNLRGVMLPIIDLRAYFGEPSQNPAAMGIVAENSLSRRFLLAVDSVVGKQDVVIKSFGTRFAELKAISSGTALTGGKIGYILNIDFIIEDQEKTKEQIWNSRSAG